jgi:dTDP-4-dehydrorhamnose 3,5-epimerase
VNALDPDIGIEWPVDVKPILSDKDAVAPSLRTAQSNGILPDYASCLAWTVQLRGSLPAH